MALKPATTTSPISQNVRELLKAQAENTHTELSWTLGHIDTAGDKKADAAAKNAAEESTGYCRLGWFLIQILEVKHNWLESSSH